MLVENMTPEIVKRLTNNKINNYFAEIGSENVSIQQESKKENGMNDYNGAINGAFRDPEMKFTTKM